MATTIQEAFVTVRPDMDGFERETEGGIRNALSGVAKIAAGILGAQVVANAAQGIKDFVGGSIQAAADLEQSIGGVESVFKDSAGTILDWGKTAWQQAGLSENAFNQLASSTGAFLKNFGFDQETVTGTTIELTQRAADMAAMFGGPVEDAMAAIQAGLRGQQDPLERYGVSLTAARVEAHALAMTGKEVTKELTDQEKMTARLDLIMRQTADSAGQFGREQDTAAGKAAIQQAAMANLSAELGNHLLPIQVKVTEAKLAFVRVLSQHVVPTVGRVVGLFNSQLSPAFSAAGEFISNAASTIRDFAGDIQWAIENGTGFDEKLVPQLGRVTEAIAGVAIFVRDELVPAFQSIADRVRPAAEAIGEFFSSEREAMLKAIGLVVGTVLVAAFASLAIAAGSAAIGVIAATAPVLAIGVAIGALAFGIVKLIEHWDDITGKAPILGAAFDAVRAVIGTVVEFVTGRLMPALAEAVEKFRNDVAPALENVGTVLLKVGEHVLGFIDTALTPLKVALGIARDVFVSIWDEIRDYLKAVLDLMVQLVENAIELIRDTISIVLAVLRGDWEGAWEGIKTLLSNVWENMRETVASVLDVMQSAISLAWETVKSITREAWELVAGLISGAVDGILEALGRLKDIGVQLVTGLLDGAKSILWDVLTFFWELPGEIVSQIPNPLDVLWSIGKQIIQGLINGIAGMAGAVADAVGGVVSGAVSGAKSILGIRSPSSVFKYIGDQIMAGLRSGILEAGDAVVTDALKIMNDLVNGFEDGIMTIEQMIAKWGDQVVSEMTDTYREAVRISNAIAAELAKGAAGQAVLGSSSSASSSVTVTHVRTNAPTAPNPHAASVASDIPGLTQAQKDYIDFMNATQMAEGGIVRARPGGTVVRVGEAGRDEAIVPLDGRRFGGGNTVIGPQQIVLPNVRNGDDFMRVLDMAVW